MKLDALIRSMPGAQVRQGGAAREIGGLACDSRQVRPGYLFFAVPGARCDGLEFVDEAIERGAVAVVSAGARASARDVALVQVPDVRAAMAGAARAFHGDPSASLSMVGVTGTNGKTTITFMVRDVLRAHGAGAGLIGTVEYQIGERVIPAARTTPESLDLQAFLAQMVQAGARYAVMEVSSHALVQRRVEGIDYDVAVFTNLTRDHLDYHKTMDAYFEAKRMLFESLGRGRKEAAAVINADDPWGRRLAAMPDLKARLLTYGRESGAAVRARQVVLAASGSTFTVDTPWGSRPVSLRLLGKFNVYNALAAIGACGALGVPLDRIVETLGAVGNVPGRLELIPSKKGFQVFVDYAHTDDALRNVLETLREIAAGRLLVVFGCGGNRDRTKRPVMGRVAGELADYSIVTSDNPRKEDPLEIIREIEGGFPSPGRHEVVPDRADAIRRAIALARPGDIVLIAGKGHENFQEFANRLVPFDDRQVARNCV